MSHSSGYSPAQVAKVLEGYAELRARAGTYGYRLYILAELIDLSRALRVLTPKELEAAYLIGLLGWTYVETGEALGIADTTAMRRYSSAIARMTLYLNTGRRR